MALSLLQEAALLRLVEVIVDVVVESVLKPGHFSHNLVILLPTSNDSLADQRVLTGRV